jgi:CTP:molybdopterin cytidylyltransferase MocA
MDSGAAGRSAGTPSRARLDGSRATQSAARRQRVACVVLAAGESRRLGTPKQLLRRRGRPLLVSAIDAARGALPNAPIVVVLGAQALRLRTVLRRRAPAVHVTQNPRWRDGLATSLQRGLAAARHDSDAILVLLTDQPNVGAAALRRLLAAWQRRPTLPAAAFYSDRAGVPAILPRRSWPAITMLHGDEGARALLRGHEGITLVDLSEAALDIDTPADLERLR